MKEFNVTIWRDRKIKDVADFQFSLINPFKFYEFQSTGRTLIDRSKAEIYVDVIAKDVTKIPVEYNVYPDVREFWKRYSKLPLFTRILIHISKTTFYELINLYNDNPIEDVEEEDKKLHNFLAYLIRKGVFDL
jgi:hypothetical protein